MSGLYNMLMGRNPATPLLLGIVGITAENVKDFPIGRFRDCYITADGKTVGVFTRNGGLQAAEREKIEESMETSVLYRGKEVDDSDPTYITYFFEVGEEHASLGREVAALTDNTPCMKKFRQLLQDMEDGKETEQTKHAKEVGQKIADAFTSDEEFCEVKAGIGSVVVYKPKGKEEV